LKTLLPILLILFLSTISYCNETFNFTILHTNDLHSHFQGTGPDISFTPEIDNDPVLGAYPRIAHLIRKIKKSKKKLKEPVLTLDAGDFFSGTLFHILGPNIKVPDTPELKFFDLIKYDAVTLGNHEFDAGEKGLAIMLEKAKKQNFNFPIISSNMILPASNPELTKFFSQPSPNSKQFGLYRYTVKDLKSNGKTLRVGILGILGPDACQASAPKRKYAKFYGYNEKKKKADFDELEKTLQSYVNSLKKAHNAEVIILLGHSGSPEDEKILSSVEGIDIMISGHTHEVYVKTTKNTITAQASSFGRRLGMLELSFSRKIRKVTQRTVETGYKIDDAVPSDKDVLALMKGYKKSILTVLKSKRFKYDTPIVKIESDFLRKHISKDPLSIFATSKVLEGLNKHSDDKIDLFFSNVSLIRSSFKTAKGKPVTYQFSDIFKFFPIGFDEKLNPGEDIISFYMTKSDFKKLLNFAELYKHTTKTYIPVSSDTLNYEIRNWGIPFINRLKSMKLHGKPYDEWPELIHIATNRYLGYYFLRLPELSYGLLDLKIRNKNGKVLSKLPKSSYPKEYELFAETLSKAKKPIK
jgi:2',3'-cyclic-nucleotide 2'-phosphodiesterase (5'-nucleotidase family)